MPETHVISGLKDKRARLAGELEQAKRRVIELRISLLHVDSCLRLFDQGCEPNSIRPKPPRKANPAGVPNGAGSWAALDVLRETGEAFDSNELARRVLVKLGKEITPEAIRMLGVTIQSTFSRSKARLVDFDRSTWPGRWTLKKK